MRRWAVRTVVVALGALAPLAGSVSWAHALPTPISVPSTVDPTGAQDVTSELQQVIDEAPDGSTVLLAPGARYRVEGTLRLVERQDLTIDGNGAETFATTRADRDRRHWSFLRGSNLTVRNLTVTGPNEQAGSSEDGAYVDALQGQHAFDVNGTDGILLDHVAAADTYGDWVNLRNDLRGHTARNVVVRDSQFRGSGRQGITISDAADVLITGNTFEQAQRSTIDIEPNGPAEGARRVRIAGNDVGAGRHSFLSVAGHAAPVQDIVVQDNRFHGRQFSVLLNAPGSSRRGPFSIVGNTSDTPYGGGYQAPVVANQIDGLVVRGNVIPLQGRDQLPGVYASQSCGLVVRDNQFPGSTRALHANAAGYACPRNVDNTPSAPNTDDGTDPVPVADPVPQVLEAAAPAGGDVTLAPAGPAPATLSPATSPGTWSVPLAGRRSGSQMLLVLLAGLLAGMACARLRRQTVPVPARVRPAPAGRPV